MKKLISLLSIIFLASANAIYAGEMNSWECNTFEDAKIIGDDGDYLGRLGPSYMSDSIYNSSSSYSSTYSSDSIFNSSSKYGNTYSSTSVFNDGASSPPIILASNGISLGKLSVGPSYSSDRYDPYDIKYTCDWD